MKFYANTETGLIAGNPESVQDDNDWGVVIFDQSIGSIRLDVNDGYLQLLAVDGSLTIEPQASNHVRIRVNVPRRRSERRE